MNDVLRMIRSRGLTAGELKLTPEYLAELVTMVNANKINATTGKDLIERVQESGESPAAIVDSEDLAQVSDEAELERIAQSVLAENPDQLETFRSGKETILGWFVGQVMRNTQGKANPQLVREVLEKLLKG
jgi:aspartyl-tRNA(Asn)/glutamyl-tRNA(Gln) amidotransferase subunit B